MICKRPLMPFMRCSWYRSLALDTSVYWMLMDVNEPRNAWSMTVYWMLMNSVVHSCWLVMLIVIDVYKYCWLLIICMNEKNQYFNTWVFQSNPSTIRNKFCLFDSLLIFVFTVYLHACKKLFHISISTVLQTLSRRCADAVVETESCFFNTVHVNDYIYGLTDNVESVRKWGTNVWHKVAEFLI